MPRFSDRNSLGTHRNRVVIVVLVAAVVAGVALAQAPEQYEPIDSSVCTDCHDVSPANTDYWEDLEHSTHEGLECLDCHKDRATDPHQPDEKFYPGCEGCRECHEEASEQYQAHGRAQIGSCEDMPHCSDCHGDHDVLPSNVKRSKVHPVNLPNTCGKCHENLDITTKYDILIDHPIEIYERSVHGKATRGGVYVAATCNDCHSTGGSAHKILSPGSVESSINHFNIPRMCGQCHKGVENDFWEGIHGKLVARGETDAPVCTDCHGEHGILSPDDPRSPVSRSKVAESTCSPCHESAVLNEKYGLKTDRLTTFIDSYHGLKSKAGDTHVANCASCHGVHRILASSDSTSTIHAANLQKTCGECHPAISAKMAATPIHGVTGQGLRTPVADVVEKIYIIAIFVIIGLMVIHWLIDLGRQLRNLFNSRPQVRRMRTGEVWQHALLALSFVGLVITGFALRYDHSGFARFFFGWDRGFEIRGLVHRISAMVFIFTVLWHVVYLSTMRGRVFIRDIMPMRSDFRLFGDNMLYNLGRRKKSPRFERFSYIEKAEYWALVWGTVVMILTGVMLWFDNWFIQFLPKGVLDVALVIHYWEAWLATLAIIVWHLYSTVFSPQVYPMNPSWLTGMMPEKMYEHEHPEHLETARRDTEQMIQEHIARVARKDSASDDTPPPDDTTAGPDQK